MRTLSAAIAAASLLSAAPVLASSHVDREALIEEIRTDLSRRYDLSRFDEISVRIGRRTVEVEAEGGGGEVEIVYDIAADGGLGRVIEREEEFDHERDSDDERSVEREVEDERDDDEHDDRDDDDRGEDGEDDDDDDGEDD